LKKIAQYIFWLIMLTLFGLLAELLLINHWESNWQIAPLVVLGFSIIALLLQRLTQKFEFLNLLSAALLLVAGIAGLILHYKGNAEFELEMYENLGAFELFTKSIQGATPFLAPGAMIGLGILVFIYKQVLSKINFTDK